MDIGSELKNARLRRSLSIAQLADVTKIRSSQLHAIEANDFDRLPGAIYVRAFLKAYAREVGLDADDVVARYIATLQSEPDPHAATSPSSAAPFADMEWNRVSTIHGVRLARWPALAAAVLSVWAATSYLAFQRANVPEAASSDVPAIAGLHSTATGGEPRATAATGASPVSASLLGESAGAIRVELQATGLCWVAAEADGRQVVSRLWTAGEGETVDVREAIRLRVGDPSTFKFSINGVPGRPLGAPGEAVTVRITPENYARFVAGSKVLNQSKN